MKWKNGLKLNRRRTLRAIIPRSHLESTPEGMIHASAETAVIVAPAAMETVETVKKVAEGTVDTIAEEVETELTTDIKEEIEGKMEINEESGVKVVSIDEKIAGVAEKADDSTVHGIKKESWKSDRVDSMITAETDAIAHVTGNRATAATTAAGATSRASFVESAKAAAIDKEDATSTVTGNSAKIDRRDRDNTTTTTGVLVSIDRATIDAGAMTMTVAIDVEADAALEADMTIAPMTVQRGFSTSRRVSRPTKKLKIRSLSKKARISTNTTTST